MGSICSKFMDISFDTRLDQGLEFKTEDDHDLEEEYKAYKNNEERYCDPELEAEIEKSRKERRKYNEEIYQRQYPKILQSLIEMCILLYSDFQYDQAKASPSGIGISREAYIKLDYNKNLSDFSRCLSNEELCNEIRIYLQSVIDQDGINLNYANTARDIVRMVLEYTARS